MQYLVEHLDILQDVIADARGPLPGANWARGIEMQFATLSSPSGVGALDSHGFMARMAEGQQQSCDSLYVSSRTAPSKGARLCTYYHWLGRTSKLYSEPYFELPMSITRLLVFKIRVGAFEVVEAGATCVAH